MRIKVSAETCAYDWCPTVARLARMLLKILAIPRGDAPSKPATSRVWTAY